MLEKDQVQDVEIEFGDNKAGFKKTAKGWIQTDQGAHAELLDQMDRILEDLSRSFILSFDENGDQDAGQQGLTPPNLRVKVSKGFDGQTVLFGHQAQEGFVYARIEGRPGTMQVEKPLLWKILISR
jgi:hypothetical protein